MDELYNLYEQLENINDEDEIQEIQEKIIYLQDEEDFGEGW